MRDLSATRSATDCLRDDDAVGYVEGSLDADARARADAHMAGCSACRWLVSALTHRSDGVSETVVSSAGSVVATAPPRVPSPEPEPEGLPPGTAVGRYHIVRLVGSGGMGTVYAAHDPVLDREVAIKVLPPRGTGRREAQARLLREAHAMARLSHPGVVPIYDVGAVGDGVFLAMELVDGQDARAWLARAKPSWREAISVLASAGRGLAAAHAAGIVHRDVKPANVLIGRDGRARVTDFGLARTAPRGGTLSGSSPSGTTSSAGSSNLMARITPAPESRRRRVGDGDIGSAPTTPLGGRVGPGRPSDETATAAPEATSPGVSASDASSDPPLTRDGTIMGTPMYMAPEQHEGRPADARADQFSFCVLLYEAVYGERPFGVPADATTPPAKALASEVVEGHVRAAPPGSGVPGWLRRILLRGLAPRPEARWPSVDALLDAIDETPRRRRRPWIAAGAVATVGLVAAAFAAGRAEPRPAICTSADRELAATWAPADRSAAVHRLAGLGSYGAALAPRLGRQLDDFASRWVAGHRDACLAQHRGAQSDQMMDRRTACLARGRAALGEVAAIVRSADTATLPGVALAASALPDPTACGDLDALAAAHPPPPPELAAAVAAVAADIERARVLIATGSYAAARDLAVTAVAAARTTTYEPILAEALLAEGHARMSADGRDDAIPLLTEATALALETGNDALAVEAWARRAWVIGTGETGTAELDGATLIDAVSARPHAGAFARALLHNNVGAVAAAHGQRDSARASFERSLAEAQVVRGPGAVELINVRVNLALITTDAARRDELLAEAERELTVRLGAEHPRTLDLRWTRAMWLPNLAKVRQLLDDTCRQYEPLHATKGRALFQCWTELGYVTEELGDRPGAIAAMTRAAEFQRQSKIGTTEAAAYLALWAGDPDTSRTTFAAAASALPRTANEAWWQTLDRARMELGLARALRETGDVRTARRTLEGVVADLSRILAVTPAAAVERRLARARAELVSALQASGASSAEIGREAKGAAALLASEGGRLDEIAALERLAR